MISAWWLLLICPTVFVLGMLCLALLVIARENYERTET